MTARQIFEYALVELNKVQAPSLLLEDYNYFINKAVNQYINKIYNSYEVNQQKSDDLRVLKGTTILPVSLQDDYKLDGLGNGNTMPAGSDNNKLFGATYEAYLPDDYLHILNCIGEFEVKKTFKCYDSGDRMHFGVKKLTSDMFSQIINNYYMRPSYKNPYFFINNVNVSNIYPTRDNQENVAYPSYYYTIFNNSGTTPISNADTFVINGEMFTFKTTPTSPNDVQINNGFPGMTINNLYVALQDNANLNNLSFSISSIGGAPSAIYTITVVPKNNGNVSINEGVYNITVLTHQYNNLSAEKTPQSRYGNKSKVRMEIRYGKDNTLFELKQVYVDYLKSPQFIRLTQTQVDEVEDNSQVVEFPDYVCQEVIIELVKLLMENGSDPRLQTNIPINQSIAQPQQPQQKQ